ncbi:MAG: DUF4197 domain-containing protein [Alphaproteobacteria bacterium]|nr:DUF4197 domain-containing protein [Alphaproteobacteria bacterium]MBT7943015.1 DUF4197 domain-containing protein [Alphaproteobacteria bacterium]
MIGFRIAALALAVVVGLPPQAQAQQNLMDQLKGALGNVTGGDTPSLPGGTAGALSIEDISGGLREALRIGIERVVGQIGQADGFNSDPKIHIHLPPELQKVQSVLQKFGMAALADDVELKLNRAAEIAAPKTKDLIWKAISEMTLDDAKEILDGPDDAATGYFKRVASDGLAAVIRPIVDQTLNQVGAIASYDKLMGQYGSLPFVPNVKANLTDHAVKMTMDGVFYYLAKEEAAIRNNPAKRTTDLLAKVFGG